MRRFDACALCLNRAREPLACNEGHLFCKECVYTDLREHQLTLYSIILYDIQAVSQKKDIKRQKEKLETMKKEAEEEKARAKEGARERVLLEFEKSQLGLAAPAAAGTTTGEDSNEGE